MQNAQALLEELKQKKALADGLKPRREGEWFYAAVARICKLKTPCEECVAKFEEKTAPQARPAQGRASRSFDIVGSIAIIELPPEASARERKAAAKAVMATHPRVKTVCRKAGATGGEYRIRPVEVIAGAKTTRTTHRENGCNYHADLNKTYFQPRLSHERERIAAMVGKGERVLVLFAGTGPYAINIAKRQPAAEVVGVEINPDAARMFKENIALNKTANATAVNEDAKKFLERKQFHEWADRVVMPHPSGCHEFLPLALQACKNGATVHYYAIVENDGGAESEEAAVKATCKKQGFGCKIIYARRALAYSPHAFQCAIDFKVRRARR